MSYIETLFTSLQQVNIPLDMWLAIRAGISSFLCCDYKMPISTAHHQLTLQQAYDDQTSIGWGKFFKGRIADSWGHLMTQPYVTFHQSDLTQLWHCFQTTLITGLWTIFDNIRKLQNPMLQNPEDVSSLFNLELNKRVHTYYYRPRLYLSASDQHLLRSSRTEVLQRSLSKNVLGFV